MSDVQRIVENIQAFINGNDLSMNDDLAGWATGYADACRHLNSRLRECRDLLQKGLRSEALHLAEQHPPVLDVFSTLDFPEREQWRDLCVQYALKEAPALGVAAAQAIGDAYADDADLKALLHTHRTLNVAAAPLPRRIHVLRRIAQNDPTTAYWEDDLRKLERLRLNELPHAINAAAAAEDVVALEGVAGEVQSAEWRTPVPARLKESVAAAMEKMHAKQANLEYAATADDLDAAYSAMDVAECRTLVNRWDELVNAYGTQPGDELTERVTTAREWLEEQEAAADLSRRFEEKCASLQSGIDRDAPTPDLERLYRQITALPLPIPPRLERAYHLRLRDRAQASKRRFVVILSSVAAVVVLALSVGGYLLYRSLHQKAMGQWVTALAAATGELRTQGEREKAEAILKDVESQGARYLGEPDLAEKLSDLKAALQQDAIRVSEFKQQHDKVRSLIGSGTADACKAAMDALLPLAKRAAELAAVKQLEYDIKNYLKMNQDQRDSAFREAQAALSRSIETQLTPDLALEKKEEFISILAQLKAKYTELKSTPQITDEIKTSLCNSVEALLKQREELIRSGDTERTLIQTVMANADHQTSREDALKSYVQRFPEGAKSADFGSVLKRLDAEKAIDAFERLCRTWRTPLPPDEPTARLYLTQLQKLTADSPLLTKPLSEYTGWLNHGLSMLGDEGPYQRILKPVSESELLTTVWCVTLSNNKTYFTREDIGYKKDTISSSIQVFLSDNLSVTSTIDVEKGVAPGKAQRSPGMVFARELQRRLEKTNYATWATTSVDVLEDLQKNKSLHPVLRARLIHRVIKVNEEVLAKCGGEKLSEHAVALGELNLNDLNWMNPDSLVPATKLEQIERVVARVPDASELRKKIAERERELARTFMKPILGRSIVMARPGEKVTVRVKPNMADATLEVLPAAGEIVFADGGPTLARIGEVKNGVVVLDTPALAGIPEGSLVFIRPKN